VNEILLVQLMIMSRRSKTEIGKNRQKWANRNSHCYEFQRFFSGKRHKTGSVCSECDITLSLEEVHSIHALTNHANEFTKNKCIFKMVKSVPRDEDSHTDTTTTRFAKIRKLYLNHNPEVSPSPLSPPQFP